MLWLALSLTPIIFGFGDFLAGMFTKKVSTFAVVGVTSAVSAVGALAWSAYSNTLMWDQVAVVRGAIAGVLFTAACACFYYALSKGQAGVVGAITTLSILVPVVADLMFGELPTSTQLAGIFMILIGVVVVSNPGSLKSASRRVLLIALGAAGLYGLQFMALSRASQANSDVAILSQYAVSAVLILIAGLVFRTTGGLTRSVMPKLVGVGVFFAIGGVCLSTAYSGINVAVASAVLMAEPIVLALLGWVIDKQRLSGVQWIALIGVIAGAAVLSLA